MRGISFLILKYNRQWILHCKLLDKKQQYILRGLHYTATVRAAKLIEYLHGWLLVIFGHSGKYLECLKSRGRVSHMNFS